MRNRMKKSIVLLCITTLVLGVLSGCGNSGNTANANSQTTTNGTKNTETSESVENSDLSGVEITFLNSKGEIQEALEGMAVTFEEETGVKVEVLACGAGEVPYTKVTSAYTAGNPPTLSMLDTTDIIALAEQYAMDLSDEEWISECENSVTKVNGSVYSFPFCIEGRGLIYNKAAIENTLGREFDASTINSYDALEALLSELREAGMENPVVISKEDWSLGAHQLGFVYDAYDGTTDGSAELIANLVSGDQDPAELERLSQFLDTMDLLLEYNINGADPLGAIYEQDAIYLADVKAALWANGCWAWPNIAEGGATADDEYGFLPFILGNDISDFANTGMQAAPSKQVMIDNVVATEEEQAAAKAFLNWIVYSESGQRILVEECALIPACANNAFDPVDPLGMDIKEKSANGNTYSASFIAPSDHWSVMGAAMQKYIAGESSRDELIESFKTYWLAQKER